MPNTEDNRTFKFVKIGDPAIFKILVLNGLPFKPEMMTLNGKRMVIYSFPWSKALIDFLDNVVWKALNRDIAYIESDLTFS